MALCQRNCCVRCAKYRKMSPKAPLAYAKLVDLPSFSSGDPVVNG